MAASIVTLVGRTGSSAPASPPAALMRSPLTAGQLLALDKALWLIREEVIRAARKHGGRPFASPHEGYAVALEELDEAWEDIKSNRLVASVEEMTQVGAMAAYYITSFAPPVEAKEAANG